MKDKLITIGGKRWRLVYVPMRKNDGECDSPDTPRKAIRIAQRLQRFPQSLLEILLHEALHAADWSKDEHWIERISKDIARLLWMEGYRRPNGDVV